MNTNQSFMSEKFERCEIYWAMFISARVPRCYEQNRCKDWTLYIILKVQYQHYNIGKVQPIYIYAFWLTRHLDLNTVITTYKEKKYRFVYPRRYINKLSPDDVVLRVRKLIMKIFSEVN